MERVYLTIKSSYLPEWGVEEGIRELIQNAKDAETEFKAPMVLRHEDNTLYIENHGSEIPRAALLLGHTSKAGSDAFIGQFGEGFKLGVLAIVRSGHPCTLRTGGEIWEPQICPSEEFKEDVLTFQISNGLPDQGITQYRVGDITKEHWDTLQKKFLFLQDIKEKLVDDWTGDEILVDADQRGKIYVKGILVEEKPEFSYGYNIKASTDRDRRMIVPTQLYWRTIDAWTGVTAKNLRLCERLYLLALSDSSEGELKYMNHRVQYFTSDVRSRILELFQATYGDTIPVGSPEDLQAVSFLGKRGVVVPNALRYLIYSAMGGTFEDIKINLSNAVVEVYQWDSLREFEREHITKIVTMVNRYQTVTIKDIDICKFRTSNVRGQYCGGRIRLARWLLGQPTNTLRTLIHEVCHRVGGDGDHSHVHAIEE